jgi:hypothetical protein
MRALWLGSAGATILIRCPCGAKLYLSRRHWLRRSFTACDDCKALIRYASLDVVDPQEVEDFVSMVVKQEEEKEALRTDLERELRRFVRVFDQQPEWLWSPATVKFMRAVRPKLELLGGPIHEARGREADDASPESAYKGSYEDELSDEYLTGSVESDAA